MKGENILILSFKAFLFSDVLRAANNEQPRCLIKKLFINEKWYGTAK